MYMRGYMRGDAHLIVVRNASLGLASWFYMHIKYIIMPKTRCKEWIDEYILIIFVLTIIILVLTYFDKLNVR